MLKSNKMLVTLLVLLTVFGLDAQTFPVNWSSLRNVEVVNGILQKESNAEKRGAATSEQLLFGRGQTNTFAGYFEFTVTSINELKKIGFVALDDPTEKVGGITYGFTFLANGKVKATGINGGTAKLSYTIGDVFRIERVGGRVLRFYINGAEVYVEPGDVFQSYQIRAVLKSQNATFENVICSYETTPFCVVPEIDNVNKTIRLAISGAYPPYTYTWDHGPVLVRGTHQDPTNEPVYQVLTDGNYWVTIKDATGNEFRKRYSVGTDISWSSLYQTSSSGDLLTYTGASKWGSAVHFSSFNQNSIGWTEYVIDHNGGRRAFGFVDASQTVRKTRHLKAGFLITNVAVQVIYGGNVVFTGDYENKDVLTLHYFQGTVVWMKNGVEFYSAPYIGTGDFTIAGMLRGNAIEKHLNYSFNPDNYITKTWDDVNDQGSIEVNISSLNIPGPYHYIVSKEHIPELFELYTFITDSIGVEIDSVQFFTGSEANTSFTFGNLDAGTYNVAVFDSQGNRIFGQEVDLYGELSIEAGNGLLVAGNTVQSSQDNGAGSLELYLTQGENLGMEIKVGRNGGNIQQFIGLADEQTTVNGYQDLEYGFYLDGKKLYTVESGVLSSSFEIIRQNKTLEISIQDGELILKANMEDLVTVQLPAQYVYKVGAGMDPGAILKLNYSGKPPKKSKYRFYPNIISHLNCDDQLGVFSFSIDALANLDGSSMPYSIVNAETGQVVTANGTVNDEQSIPPVNQYANGDNLTVGIYTIDFTLAGQVYSKQICLGYEADWDDQLTVDYVETPNSYSLERNVPYSGVFSFAQTRNILLASSDGWIEFTPIKGNGLSGNLIRLSVQNLTSTIPGANEDYIYFFGLFNSIFMYSQFNGTTDVDIIQDGDRIKIVQTGNLIEVKVNGSVAVSQTVTSQTRVVRAQSLEENDAFKDVVMSFACGLKQTLDQVSHAELKKRLDGGRTLAIDGGLKFTFDGEYEVSDNTVLNYSIYNKNRSIVGGYDDQGNLVSGSIDLNYEFDDNRYLLDVSGMNLIQDEFYILNVVDSKGNKQYLKFIFKY